jgi:hypothetical protein
MARVPGCDANYRIAELWKKECLTTGRSWLFESQIAWTDQAIDDYLSETPIQESSTGVTGGSFEQFGEAFGSVFAGRDLNTRIVAIDAYALCTQFENWTSGQKKLERNGG